MIANRDTTVGYHCPHCGMPILNRINIFTMEGNLVKMKCVCGGSELMVQIQKNHKYQITAPCIMCPNPHTFALSSAAFFQKDLFALSCKFTAVNICFIGKGNRVYNALKKNEQELIKAFGEFEELDDMDDADDFGDDFLFDDDDEFWDGEDDFDEEDFRYEKKEPGFIAHINKDFDPGSAGGKTEEWPIDEIKDIKIGSYQAAAQILALISHKHEQKKIICKCKKFDGILTISAQGVRVECKNCGSYRDIKTSGAADADYLGESDRLYLDYDD
ncbi:MAG: hypothetical protein FWG34_00300 [Oscillospiraceae bacterium]|nr:hypothetical protein [Oscillospiraceae bacterium]